MELIEAQRGKAASSVGKKQAADTALANEWANLQLQSFGQFGADPAAIAGQQAGQTAGGWLRSSAAKDVYKRQGQRGFAQRNGAERRQAPGC